MNVNAKQFEINLKHSPICFKNLAKQADIIQEFIDALHNDAFYDALVNYRNLQISTTSNYDMPIHRIFFIHFKLHC